MRIINKYITDDFKEFYDLRKATDYENQYYKPVKAILDKLGEPPEQYVIGTDNYIFKSHNLNLVHDIKWELIHFLVAKQVNRVNAIGIVMKRELNHLKEPVINQSNIIITLLDRLFKIDDKGREWNCDIHFIPIEILNLL